VEAELGEAGDVRHRVVDTLVRSLDEDIDGDELARRVHFAKYHFSHLVKRTLGESPGAFRRRLLLERAADELRSTSRSIAVIACGAGYGSAEAFTHAFHRAYGMSPLAYRRRDGSDHRLAAPNGVHYMPPARARSSTTGRRAVMMDLTDRLVEHDIWHTDCLLTCAGRLSDEELDEPIVLNPPSAAFNESSPSLRAMLNRLVLAKEMWVASISGHALPPTGDMSIEGMRARLYEAANDFKQHVGEIRQRNAWNTAYLDTTQHPPNTNTFGASVAHVLQWGAARREIIAAVLTARGMDPVSLDPVQWEFGSAEPERGASAGGSARAREHRIP
jgi:AraC family transcriptional regulator